MVSVTGYVVEFIATFIFLAVIAFYPTRPEKPAIIGISLAILIYFAQALATQVGWLNPLALLVGSAQGIFADFAEVILLLVVQFIAMAAVIALVMNPKEL